MYSEKIFGLFTLYGLCIAIGVLCCVLVLFKFAKGKVKDNFIEESLIDKALLRILNVKKELGLFDKQEKIIDYFEKTNQFINFIGEMIPSWTTTESELHSVKLRSNYASFVATIKMFCSSSVLSGTQFFVTLNNIDNFIQASIKLVGQNRMNKKYNTVLKNLDEDNRGFFFCKENGIIEWDGNYYSLSKYVHDQIADPILNSLKNFNALLENKDYSSICSLMDMIPLTATILTWSYSNVFLKTILKACVDELIEENPEKVKDFYDLTEKFPIVFNVDENSDLIRVVEEIKEPYISFEYKDLWGEHDDPNYTNFTMRNTQNELTIVIRFNNMERLGTIHYSILENAAHNWSFVEQNKFKVSWGNWVGSHACELNFKQLTTDFGSIKVKVWADCNPDCEGIIEGR